mmetsp:Transcript_10064/g.42323  ORF Transcript_10064/g.42323 Transcript_10064/m.42323 type:complete len:83 (+) Transcript_10064:1181-1429(+)
MNFIEADWGCWTCLAAFPLKASSCAQNFSCQAADMLKKENRVSSPSDVEGYGSHMQAAEVANGGMPKFLKVQSVCVSKRGMC